MIALIVAYSKNRVIGNNGMIPWKLKGEQKRFRELTTGNIVVMGRHSFEEIGKPLPNRMTYLVSSTMVKDEENCKTVASLVDAISMANGKDIYIYQVAQCFTGKHYHLLTECILQSLRRNLKVIPFYLALMKTYST